MDRAPGSLSSPATRRILEREHQVRMRGFHSDNGSDYINADVSRLLRTLLIGQTQSRWRHSNDNAPVEAKNGAVIRKHLVYGYIDAQHAAAITEFYHEHLNVYVNFHRPCAPPPQRPLGNGRIQRVYRRWVTRWELRAAVPRLQEVLRPGGSAEALQARAAEQSDTEAALSMQQAKRELFQRLGRKIA
ncbi:MAG: hypothetical protein ACUVXB_17470 [Bryobacteraceae bacterium]